MPPPPSPSPPPPLRAGDTHVLITGFGPFGSIETDTNPSWLAIQALHNTFLSPSSPPAAGADAASNAPRIHIQVLQSAVGYAHVLSLVPRLHGCPPSAHSEPWLDVRGAQPAAGGCGPQGCGKPYPAGYALQHPPGGFDVVLHVGVGYPGALAVEQLAHKRRYQMTDARGEHAPRALDQSTMSDVISDAEARERARLERAAKGEAARPLRVPDTSCVRGFAEGYEAFQDEERSSVDVDALVAWLKQQGTEHVRPSLDAGRFLCDFIYYASLCEAQRARPRREQGGKRAATVLFMHVPPVGEPLSLDQMTEGIRNAAWWLATTMPTPTTTTTTTQK